MLKVSIFIKLFQFPKPNLPLIFSLMIMKNNDIVVHDSQPRPPYIRHGYRVFIILVSLFILFVIILLTTTLLQRWIEWLFYWKQYILNISIDSHSITQYYKCENIISSVFCQRRSHNIIILLCCNFHSMTWKYKYPGGRRRTVNDRMYNIITHKRRLGKSDKYFGKHLKYNYYKHINGSNE